MTAAQYLVVANILGSLRRTWVAPTLLSFLGRAGLTRIRSQSTIQWITMSCRTWPNYSTTSPTKSKTQLWGASVSEITLPCVICQQTCCPITLSNRWMTSRIQTWSGDSLLQKWPLSRAVASLATMNGCLMSTRCSSSTSRMKERSASESKASYISALSFLVWTSTTGSITTASCRKKNRRTMWSRISCMMTHMKRLRKIFSVQNG